jgi:imidazolonepropionase-like amidohydrolase
MAQPWTFKELLQRAKDYLQRRSRYEQELKDWNRDRKEAEGAGKPIPREPAEVPEDEDLEPFGALFAKQIPALVHAGRSDEITNALKVFCDESGFPVVLVGASDGFRIPNEIRRRGAAVALGPQSIRQVGGGRVNMAQKLAEAGVTTLFQSSSPSGAELLRLNAALAVRGGMNPNDALQALTISPARALMVADRIGSIEVGKDADLVILSGDPWQVISRIRMVLVNGKVAYNGN